MAKETREDKKLGKIRYSKHRIKENIELYAIMLPVIIMIIIFCYIPLYGLIISF